MFIVIKAFSGIILKYASGVTSALLSFLNRLNPGSLLSEYKSRPCL